MPFDNSISIPQFFIPTAFAWTWEYSYFAERKHDAL